uniref:Uncharacterized protein n=1 Tax=Parascaris equorum TaxID=6256 RepID=A0A914RGV2_PAREQ
MWKGDARFVYAGALCALCGDGAAFRRCEPVALCPKRLSGQECFIDTIRAVSGVGLRLMDSILACTEETYISERPSGGSVSV